MSEDQRARSKQISVEIYTRHYCSFCIRAKQLLDQKGVSYTEYSIDGDYEAREKMIERAEGRRTVPQIFIHGRPIGGYTELALLEAEGKLDALLKTDA